MKKGVFDKHKRVPRYLVPTIKKIHATEIYATAQQQWKLFAEGCLRNRYFHEQVLKRGPKCLACKRKFNHANATTQSKIEKHHNSYTRLCLGPLLPAGHEDIYRKASKGEFQDVPNCRQCRKDNPEYFEGCLKIVFPVHGECHGDIHELERYYRKKRRKQLLADFRAAGKSWLPMSFLC